MSRPAIEVRLKKKWKITKYEDSSTKVVYNSTTKNDFVITCLQILIKSAKIDHHDGPTVSYSDVKVFNDAVGMINMNSTNQPPGTLFILMNIRMLLTTRQLDWRYRVVAIQHPLQFTILPVVGTRVRHIDTVLILLRNYVKRYSSRMIIVAVVVNHNTLLRSISIQGWRIRKYLGMLRWPLPASIRINTLPLKKHAVRLIHEHYAIVIEWRSFMIDTINKIK